MSDKAYHDRIAYEIPRLTLSTHRKTSDENPRYNCIAWAAGKTDKWWDPIRPPGPGVYWPGDVPRSRSLFALKAVFKGLGYEECEGGELEDGYERVALYEKDDSWCHAAKQTPDGNWSSKLGEWVDIEHELVSAVGGRKYGDVYVFMRRAISATK